MHFKDTDFLSEKESNLTETNCEEEEESLTDKIGDTIVEGIHKVGAIICAPFEWMTDKIIERM
jgi:hypothetical protein